MSASDLTTGNCYRIIDDNTILDSDGLASSLCYSNVESRTLDMQGDCFTFDMDHCDEDLEIVLNEASLFKTIQWNSLTEHCKYTIRAEGEPIKMHLEISISDFIDTAFLIEQYGQIDDLAVTPIQEVDHNAIFLSDS